MSTTNENSTCEHYDVFVIGGGVNGAGIARDAAGRGYKVGLCEINDFGGGTSSASTKLFHGGLRYLEYFEFRLVREALIERETLLRAMPHISWPMRFVLPLHDEMGFEGQTPASRLLSSIMPWLKGKRPNWMIRFGLFLYDHIGGRKILPGTKTLDLRNDPTGAPLQPKFLKAFEYSDCWIEDSRLVILNLRHARELGATIKPRTGISNAHYTDGKWHLTLANTTNGQAQRVTANAVVNATGPWVDQVLKTVFGRNDARNVRLVRGSHIVIARKFDHDKCYFFQNADGRIIFAIPYEHDFTLIGTTDADHDLEMPKPEISETETQYLCDMASQYFLEPVTKDDIVWTYSGVRPLYDDGASSAQAATRDYVIRPDKSLGQGSLINIFGGKITTYRCLAESALEELESLLGVKGKKWTAGASMPGGDFPVDGYDDLVIAFAKRFPFIEKKTLARWVRHYGTDLDEMLAQVTDKGGLGREFGFGLCEAELRYLIKNEWARTAQDVLYRRTKLGVRMSEGQRKAVDEWMVANV